MILGMADHLAAFKRAFAAAPGGMIGGVEGSRLDSLNPRHATWKPGVPTCAVYGCGRTDLAGFLRDLCMDHALEVHAFRRWLLNAVDADAAALRPAARDDLEQ
jgi:hypothetical protein